MEYNIPNLFNNEENILFMYFSVPYVVIPNSFYTINDTNNTLVVLQSSVTTTYTFTKGVYNANTFSVMFILIMGTGWNISLNVDTLKYTISHNTASFTFKSSSTCDYIIGFSGDVSSLGLSLTMPRLCNFLPLPRILIRCPEIGLNAGNMVNINTTSDIIASIPNTSKTGSQIVYESDTRYYLQVDKLQKLIISFTDDIGNLINFNGVASYFTLKFEIYRRYIEKPPSFSDLVKSVNNQSIMNELKNKPSNK
jgi:hypothetical protein